MAKQLAFYYDQSVCTGCKACQIACKDDNDLEVGVLWRRVVELNGGNWIKQGATWVQNIVTYHLSMSCNHCEDGICLKVCPTGAMHKRDDGIVLIDQDKCIGCRYCQWACPYDAPQYVDDKGKMSKCDFCYNYIDEGLPPACVAACPMRALDFGELSELQAKYGTVNNIYPMPDPSLTQPAVVITPHPGAMVAAAEGISIGNAEEM
ncbi:MAG TPA: dimethylsulfoxide reductase subunit B [Aggregatilinea sp.]|uniref:DMSO/selenate family reductase complex B subunit n=1 Tax=Aggregatilinea sp. TaxID=2806333 RepID=UPI002C50CC0D|nr:DMSO/selenate family reductase complex B subunit [Aggregatilinea sp.]HML20885.1 dimethylsulfoxide reductase subunit B [Aggregatilinea sp.]